jgi:sugar lactone lactonase YvrE
MKAYRLLTITHFFIAALIAAFTGCKVDVAESPYSPNNVEGIIPEIIAINPSQALGGVNKITIIGNNFADSLKDIHVYFNNIPPEIVKFSKDTLTVLRPNLSGDPVIISIVCDGALLVAKRNYKISPPMDKFISLATQIDGIEIDRDENLYFADRISREIYQVTPAGGRKLIDTARAIVSDMKFAPSGKLLIVSSGSNVIDQVDITTGVRTPWVYLVNRLSICDFDSNGNFYVGGLNRSLYVVRPDTSRTPFGGYTTENIFCLRVYNGYVYVLTANSVIWRNQILDASGSLGSRQQVLNLRGSGFPSSPQKFAFSASGLLYIASNDTSGRTIVTYDLNNGQMETLYKGIIPSSPVLSLVWGTGNLFYLYTTSSAKYDILRINAGTQGAPYYGR